MAATAASSLHKRKRARSALKITFSIVIGVLIVLIAASALWSLSTNQQIDASEIYDFKHGAHGQFANINGYALHYQLKGDPKADPTGAPILLIHGFSSSGDEFKAIAPTLAATRSLILPDLLGFGYSQRVAEPVADYSHRGQAALLAGLLDQRGVKQADVIGSSYGGAVAAQFALDYPEHVRRIVFLDAQVYDQSGGFTAVNSLPFRLGRAVAWSFLGGGPGARALIQSACPDTAAACAGEDALNDRLRIAQIRGNTDALLAFTATPRDVRVPRDLGQIGVPVLAMWGEKDQLVPLANGQRLANDVPGAQLIVIAGAGHTPHIEQPSDVGPMIQAFLAQ